MCVCVIDLNYQETECIVMLWVEEHPENSAPSRRNKCFSLSITILVILSQQSNLIPVYFGSLQVRTDVKLKQ